MHINTYNTSGSIYALELHNNSTELFKVMNDGQVRIPGQLRIGAGSDDGYFFSDTNGRTAFAGGNFYIQNSVSNFYNYATNQYYGDSSGDNIYFRGNTISGNSWNIAGSGAATLGTITLNNNASVQLYTSSGDSGTGSVHLPRGGHLTFYGNNNSHHSIASRNHVGTATDDLRINSYAAVYINLDSNSNNTSTADFIIGRHGGGTGTMSNLFSVSGENGSVISNNNITAYGSASDIRLKENIEVIKDPIHKVQKLRGVTFNYKKDGSKSTGLIAQELEEVLPEVIYETHDLHDKEDKFKAVRYGNVVGLLVEAIKEQQETIEEQKNLINRLEERLNKLEENNG
jgi:hypothetical protein